MDDEDKIAKEYMSKILKTYRTNAKLSQQQLADSVGVSKPFVCNLEKGKKAPSIDLLILIAEALSVKAGDMVNDMVELANKARYTKK